MNKFIAIIALAVVACAAGAMASICVGEHCDWNCGAGGNGHSTEHLLDVFEWSNNNDNLCKAACKKGGTNPVYKKGNWALYTDGVRCCCSVFTLFGDNYYYETSPRISNRASEKFNINSRIKPSD